jgi:hypothetical protein
LLVQVFEIRVFPKHKKTEIRLSGRFRLPRGEAFFVVFNPSFRVANSEAEFFLVILCTFFKSEVLSPEADLRPHPFMHTVEDRM